MMQKVLLYSSGLDSFLARYWMKDILKFSESETKLVYMNYKGRYSEYEIKMLEDQKKRFHIDVEVVDMLNLGNIEQDDAYIPNRNILMFIAAQAYTQSEEIYIGGTKSDNVNDNNEQALESITNMMSVIHNKQITCGSPFYGKYKTELVEWWVKKKHREGSCNESIAYDLAQYTFSCYNPTDLHDQGIIMGEQKIRTTTHECLQCPACFRKNVELHAGANILRPFYNFDLMDSYELRFKDQYPHDEKYHRANTTMGYINALKT